MMQPKLLILDEPSLGLAPVILEEPSKALTQLREATDITVLLGEQNVTFALPHADRVYLLEHAQVIWEGGRRALPPRWVPVTCSGSPVLSRHGAGMVETARAKGYPTEPPPGTVLSRSRPPPGG
ncbi:MAG: hypothetical protein ACREE1_00505 [Stellaceae bacterium]